MRMSFPYGIDATGRTASSKDDASYVRGLIEQVLFTSPGERVGRPAFGTGVQQLLFAPAGDEMATATAHLVRGALQQWLARWIEVHDVEVHGVDSTLEITVRYVLRSSGTTETARFAWEV